MRTYPDETLEFYGDRFVLLRLARHGVTLAQYLANVDRFERLALENEPLLEAQRAPVLRLWADQDTGLGVGGVSPRLSDGQYQDVGELLARWKAEREVAHLPQRNGAVIEPLRHHCHPPRSKGCFFNKRGA